MNWNIWYTLATLLGVVMPLVAALVNLICLLFMRHWLIQARKERDDAYTQLYRVQKGSRDAKPQ